MLKVFVSYPYHPLCENFAQSLYPLLKAIDIDVVDGKQIDASRPIPTEIIDRIKQCHVLISLLFESQKSPWVDQEVGIALGVGLDVIIITDGVVELGGAISSQYHINRSDGDAIVCGQLAHSIQEIKKRRAVDPGPAISQNPPANETDKENWPNEIKQKLVKMRNAFADASMEVALELATEYYHNHDNCWRFAIGKASAFIHLNCFDDAKKILNDIIDKYKRTPRALSYAHDNFGWLLNRSRTKGNESSFEEELQCYQTAILHEARFVTYFNLIQCLLDMDRAKDAEQEFVNCLSKFPCTVEAFRKQLAFQGAEFAREISKSHLISTLVFCFD